MPEENLADEMPARYHRKFALFPFGMRKVHAYRVKFAR